MAQGRNPTYCNLCSYSHEQGYRHIYTNKHKLKVENACKKLKSKAKLLISSLNSAGFERAAVFSEINKTIWCYACNEEVLSHWCDDNEVVILNYAAFHHFACDSHQKAVTNFLTDNRLLKKEDAKLYSIDSATAKRIMEKIDTESKRFRQDIEQNILEESERLKNLEARQLHITNMNAPHQPTTSQSNRLIHAAVEVDCDVNNGSPCEIGPSLEDFHQHLKSVKNKKEEQLLEKRGYNNTATTMYPKDIPTKSQKKDAGGDSDVPASVQVQPYKRRRKD